MNKSPKYASRTRRRVNKLGDFVRAALDLKPFNVSILIGDNSVGGEKISSYTGEYGEDVSISLYGKSVRFQLPLTTLTSEELAACKQIFDMAFANAQPIVAERDRIAQEALDEGDDSYSRIYRAVPTLLVREGQKWEHYPRLRRGSDWVEPVDNYEKVRILNVRPSSSDLPERDEGSSITPVYPSEDGNF